MARQLWVAGVGSDQRKGPAHDRIVGRPLRAGNDELGRTHQHQGEAEASAAGEDGPAAGAFGFFQPPQGFIDDFLDHAKIATTFISWRRNLVGDQDSSRLLQKIRNKPLEVKP